jgi:hypothetical protein
MLIKFGIANLKMVLHPSLLKEAAPPIVPPWELKECWPEKSLKKSRSIK